MIKICNQRNKISRSTVIETDAKKIGKKLLTITKPVS